MKQAALGADAEANREVQDDGQGTQIEQKGAPHCQEVHLPLEEASEENAQHTEVSLAGEDQRPKIAMVPFEPEATTAIIDPTCSPATHTIQAPAGGTLDAKTGSPRAGHTSAGI
jgi:hypothetical protein